MKVIEMLSEKIEAEIYDAEEYIECSMKYKEDDMMLSKMFYDLSVDELKHANMLHDNATRIINEYKHKGEVVPPEMQAIYDYLHERHIKRFNDVKIMQATFKG